MAAEYSNDDDLFTVIGGSVSIDKLMNIYFMYFTTKKTGCIGEEIFQPSDKTIMIVRVFIYEITNCSTDTLLSISFAYFVSF